MSRWGTDGHYIGEGALVDFGTGDAPQWFYCTKWMSPDGRSGHWYAAKPWERRVCIDLTMIEEGVACGGARVLAYSDEDENGGERVRMAG